MARKTLGDFMEALYEVVDDTSSDSPNMELELEIIDDGHSRYEFQTIEIKRVDNKIIVMIRGLG